jgi:2,3-bisphosphoglycerate-independent phosphoglycerate mutase
MKNPELKAKVLERIDSALEPLLDLSEDYVLLLTGDHTTPCSIGKHSGDPIPLMISGKGIPRDDVGRFDELRCIRGWLGTLLGIDLMKLILNYSNRASEHGLRPKIAEIPYIPKPDELTPLSLNQR